ncbi:MAG: alpha/beta hydrolase-fold protein [Chloroflexota bacterium]
MEPWSREFNGRFERQIVSSTHLRDNPLGDSAERPLWVYLPREIDEKTTQRYPCIYVLQSFTSQVDMWWNRTAFRPSVPELVDALFARGTTPATIMVFVDAWTSLGGSQFLNSPGTGCYLDYLCDDVVGFVDEHYPTRPEATARALSGHSSGGYGAMVVPMLRPDVFGALASHSGDALFDFSYMPDIAAAARALRSEYDGSYDAFWTDFRSRPAFTKRSDHPLLNIYAMSAIYSAEPDGTVVLPFDPETCMLRPDVWRRWQERDPVRMAPAHAEHLRGLTAIYLDAGKHDEYFLDLGARAFAAQLRALGIEQTLDIFEGGHGRIEYRYPIAWRFLAERLSR